MVNIIQIDILPTEDSDVYKMNTYILGCLCRSEIKKFDVDRLVKKNVVKQVFHKRRNADDSIDLTPYLNNVDNCGVQYASSFYRLIEIIEE